jgi:hypothetical protein
VKFNPFKSTPWLFPLGIFVWGDVPIIIGFWMLAMGMMWMGGKSNLFPLVVLVFWWVRALGEIIYWIHEQFAVKHRNDPDKLWGHQWMPGEAIYFGYQLFWQMVMVACMVGIILILK